MNVGADCERHHNRIETADGLGMMGRWPEHDGNGEHSQRRDRTTQHVHMTINTPP
ncbi:MAG: hypothetical protein M3N95_07950 [Actinomycetota bacterium]|nr:hypothetical protein [Actinomycetota bacterium]